MFEIIKKKQNDIVIVKLINKITGEYVSIVPDFGTNVNELVLLKNEVLHSILEGNKQLSSFNGSGVYAGAKLFPFPNRIKDGSYVFNDKKYQLPINNTKEQNALHGFVYDKPFELINKNTNLDFAEVLFKYTYNGKIDGYPFPFEITIKYQLHKNAGFTCNTIVSSNCNTPMPIADGWHPYFAIGEKVDELYLKFNSKKIIVFDNNLIPTKEKKEYNRFNSLTQINTTKFNNCFTLQPNDKKHIVEIYNSKKDVKISVWSEGGLGKYNYLQIYIPPSRSSIAIEPMTSNVNSFNNKDDLLILNKDDEFKAAYGVSIS